MSASGGPAWYEIRVAGVLDGRWAAWFDGLQISGQGEETVICGLLTDQTCLAQTAVATRPELDFRPVRRHLVHE